MQIDMIHYPISSQNIMEIMMFAIIYKEVTK